jgi:DNA-binding phage protein
MNLPIIDGNFNKNYRLPLERLYGRRILENDEYRKKSLERKSLTKEVIDDIYISMAFEKVLRELIKKEGLRRVARRLGIDSGSLYRSMMDGSNVGLNRIEAILDYFGFELKISKRKEVKPKEQEPSKSRRRKGDL